MSRFILCLDSHTDRIEVVLEDEIVHEEVAVPDQGRDVPSESHPLVVLAEESVSIEDEIAAAAATSKKKKKKGKKDWPWGDPI